MPRKFVRSTAVIDTSCLRCLLLLDLAFPQLELFRALSLRYHTIHIPQHVRNEVSRGGRRRGQLNGILQSYSFLQKCDVIDGPAAQLLYDRKLNPDAPIDRGEAEAIIQAREIGASEVLIDEREGTRVAQAHSLNTRGIIGVIKELKQNGVVSEAKPLIEECRRHGFRLRDKFVAQVLEELGEA